MLRKFCSYICSYKFRCPNPKPKIVKVKRVIRNWTCNSCGVITDRKTKLCKICRFKPKYYKYCTDCKKEVKVLHCFKDKIYTCRQCSLKKRGGKLNSNYKDGRKPLALRIRDSLKNKKLIKLTLKKFNYTCVYCAQVGGQLAVDHIYKFELIFNNFLKDNNISNLEGLDQDFLLLKAFDYSPFWNEENLQVLCRKCNWNKELEYRRLSKENVSSNEASDAKQSGTETNNPN